MVVGAHALSRPMAADGDTAAPPQPRSVETAAVAKVKRPDGTKVINGYRVLGVLGSGSFAKVKLCERETTGGQFALKVFRKGRLRRQRDFVSNGSGGMKVRTSMDKVYDEISVSKRIAHPNCIHLVAVFEEPDVEGKLYLVLEYALLGPTMEWHPERCAFYVPAANAGENTCNGLMQEAMAKSYMGDVLCGLDYLHGSRIAHRDIKPQNLLVSAGSRVKIADFGVAILMAEDMLVTGTEGTFHFYAPEMCKTGYGGHDGRKADVWAAGITLWAFLYGSVPFLSQDIAELLDRIAEAKYELPDSPNASDACRSLLRRMLAPAPRERPLCSELLGDPWCRGEGGAAARGPSTDACAPAETAGASIGGGSSHR